MDQQRTEKHDRKRGARPPWLLALSAAIALSAGAAYLWKWQQGIRGVDLLGFTSLWVAAPLALAMIMLFFYFSRPAGK